MKKHLLLIIALSTAVIAQAQTDAINIKTTGLLVDYEGNTAIDASALLQLNSDVTATQGFLVPRVALTTNSTTAAPVVSPANSLLIYNTATVGDVTPGFYFWSTGAVAWVRILSGASAYVAGNDLDYGTSATNSFDIEPTLNFVHTVSAPAANNLNLNAASGFATIINYNNGTTGATQTFRIGNGAGGADVFYVQANGTFYSANQALINSHATVGGNLAVTGTSIFGNTVTITPFAPATTSPVYSTTGGVLTLTGPTSGTNGYWTRTGTTLSTTNAGDNVTVTGLSTLAALTQAGTAQINITGAAATTIGSGTSATTIAGTSAHTGASTFGSTVTITPFATAGVVLNAAGGLLSSTAGPLPTVNGGMGANMTAGAIGAIPYSTSTTAYGTIPAVAAGSFLVSAGTNTVPAWTAPSTTTVGFNSWTKATTATTAAIKTDNQYVTGNIGIGDYSASTPGAAVDIAGNPANAFRTAYFNISASNGGTTDRPYFRGTTTHLVIAPGSTVVGSTMYLAYPGDLTGGGTVTTRIQESIFIAATGSAGGGNVGIGVAPDAIYKLKVSGKLNTSGIDENSDVRLKHNINPIYDALSKVTQMRGVTYNWRTEEFPERNFEKDLQFGLIAQELETIIPELVTTGEDGYKAIEYSHLVPVLIEAIKELEAKNNKQEDVINSLLTRMNAMENIVEVKTNKAQK